MPTCWIDIYSQGWNPTVTLSLKTTNMASYEPKVTGLSPMTGPPGTKITVRGENLGQSSNDIIKLTINGADCLPYMEWKSPKKIVTRCTKVLGSGDIVVTTNSGGVGTCDVQFNCYEENVGPTDESAVWVDEIDYQSTEKEKMGNLPGALDEYSFEISSSRFKPQLYLLHNHANANLNDLENLKTTLQVKLSNRNDPELMSNSSSRAMLIKSNLTVIMECLQILDRLSKVITTSRDTSIDNIVRSIKEGLDKTHDLFDPLLAQKDLVQSIESAMQVFRQNETLFNLPSVIETSKKNKNYDTVVKEISDVASRLKTIDIDESLIEKIERDVNNKKNDLRETIERQLRDCCTSMQSSRNVDEIKKLITHLNRLGDTCNYDIWMALEQMSDSLSSNMKERFQHFLELSQKQSKSPDQTLTSETIASHLSKKEPPPVVEFVQAALKLFNNTFYDILALGQSYFDPKDEFTCRENEEVKQDRLSRFNEHISRAIQDLCDFLREALIPDSPKLNETSAWPEIDARTYIEWLQHVLQSVISCHIHLTKVSLPTAAQPNLEDLKELVHELRKRSMEILFDDATRQVKNLHSYEDWMIEVDDRHGSITKLPMIFESNVKKALQFANETVFKVSQPDEKSILKGHAVQASLKAMSQSLINSFIDSLDNALHSKDKRPAESTHYLLAISDHKKGLYDEVDPNRLLISICNCQYTRDHVLPRLKDEFEKFELKMDNVFKSCKEKYGDYINRISEKFCQQVVRKFNDQTLDKQDLQIKLMTEHSQIFLIAPPQVNNLMTKIVNRIQEEEFVVAQL